MAYVAIDHGVGGEVGGWPGALEQRHGGTGFDVFENLWGKENYELRSSIGHLLLDRCTIALLSSKLRIYVILWD